MSGSRGFDSEWTAATKKEKQYFGYFFAFSEGLCGHLTISLGEVV